MGASSAHRHAILRQRVQQPIEQLLQPWSSRNALAEVDAEPRLRKGARRLAAEQEQQGACNPAPQREGSDRPANGMSGHTTHRVRHETIVGAPPSAYRSDAGWAAPRNCSGAM